MNINKKNKKINKKVVILALLVVAVGAAGYFIFIHHQKAQSHSLTKQDNTVDYKKPSSDQVQAGQNAKKDFITNHDQSQSQSSGETSKSSISITSQSQNGSVYQIRTIVTTSSSNGHCVLRLTKSGQTTYTKTVETQAYPEYTVCEGFDIDTTNLVKGSWQASIVYNEGLQDSATTSAMVNIK